MFFIKFIYINHFKNNLSFIFYPKNILFIKVNLDLESRLISKQLYFSFSLFEFIWAVFLNKNTQNETLKQLNL
jgi:hypothetical protein